jgi:hypothetical protein
MANLDYTDRDYDSIYARLVAAIQSDPVLRDAIDLQGGSPDRLFLVALATQGDRLSYLLNAAANETFLVRARQRDSIIDHARALAYELATAQPARTTLRFILRRTPPEGFTLRAGQVVQSDDGTVSFELDADRDVLPDAGSVDVTATEGRTLTERFVGVLAAEAPTGQRITLGEAPVIIAAGVAGRFEVTVDGVAWERVEHFLDSLPYSRHFRVERDADDRATVIFGDGATGARPGAGSTVQVTYRVGGGIRGNVRRGRLTRLVGAVLTPRGTAVDLAVSNPFDVDTGLDRESVAHARAAAPAALRSTNRSVSREDFALHAEEVPGVVRALCVTRNQDPTLGAFVHRVYIVAGARRVPGDPTSPMVVVPASVDLRRAVEEHLRTVRPGMDVEVVAVGVAPRHEVPVVATAFVPAGVSRTAFESAGIDAIYRLFDPTVRQDGAWRVDFGRTVPRSAIDAALHGVGARRVVLASPATDETIASTAFPVLLGAPTVIATYE